jgi:MarR family transcriptional regulator, lower aerobic nicotinate degradation pathway regulator
VAVVSEAGRAVVVLKEIPLRALAIVRPCINRYWIYDQFNRDDQLSSNYLCYRLQCFTEMGTATTQQTGPAQSTVLIAQLARTITHRFEETLAPLGLRPRYLVTLTYLRDHGPAPQQTLTEALCIDASNLVALLNELEDADLAVRRRDATDRRRHIVELTPHGRKSLREVARTLEAIEDDVLGALDHDQRTALRDLLERALDGEPATCRIPAADSGF